MSETDRSAPEPAGVRVVTLPAEVDYASADAVRQNLAAAFTAGVSTVIADLSGSAFCDTAGLREMIAAHQRAASRNAAFRLVVPPRLRRIFALTGLIGILDIYPTLSAALAPRQAPATEESARG